MSTSTEVLRIQREGYKASKFHSAVVNTIILFCWGLLIAAFFAIEAARPEFDSFLDRFLGFNVRRTWDFSMVKTGFFMMFTVFILSTIALLFDEINVNRNASKYNRNILSILFLSFISMSFIFFIFLF